MIGNAEPPNSTDKLGVLRLSQNSSTMNLSISKESTSLLELALWKASIDHGKAMSGGNTKLKIDPSEFRLQCRISCAADHVIENVLPYLLSDYMRSHVPDNNENGNDDNYYSDEVDDDEVVEDDEEVEDDDDNIEDVDDEEENQDL